MIKRIETRIIDDSKYYAISVDPGVKGTGIAMWEHPVLEGDMPKDVFNIMPSGPNTSWLGVAHQMVQDLVKIFEEFKIVRVDCEFPQFFDSAGGHATAARGDLQKLTFLVGNYAAVAWNYKVAFYPWLVNDWKGQMPKIAVEKAIKRRLKGIEDLGVESHMWDAIGIGLHAHGNFLLPTRNKNEY